MSDDEVEEFEINDYDLKYAMNPNLKRSRMTKEGAMLGIWAEREYSDESEDEGFANKKRSKGIQSKSISFVSGGTKGKPLEDNNDQDSDDSVN